MLTLQPLPPSALVLSLWVLAVGDVSLWGVQLYFMFPRCHSRTRQGSLGRNVWHKRFSVASSVKAVAYSFCLFLCCISEGNPLEHTDLQVIIVWSFEANLSGWAVKQRVVNKGCTHPWTPVWSKRFSIFTPSVTSSHALIVLVWAASSPKKLYCWFSCASQDCRYLHGTGSVPCLPQPCPWDSPAAPALRAVMYWSLVRHLTPLKNEVYIKYTVQALYKNEVFGLSCLKQDTKLRHRRESQTKRWLQNSEASSCWDWACSARLVPC